MMIPSLAAFEPPRLRLMRALVLAVAIGLAGGSPAWAVAYDCPERPETTTTLQNDPGENRAALEALAPTAKTGGAVCIIAYYDYARPTYSKMYAFRRATWVRQQLTALGVYDGVIFRVLRPAEKAKERLVQVIVGP